MLAKTKLARCWQHLQILYNFLHVWHKNVSEKQQIERWEGGRGTETRTKTDVIICTSLWSTAGGGPIRQDKRVSLPQWEKIKLTAKSATRMKLSASLSWIPAHTSLNQQTCLTGPLDAWNRTGFSGSALWHIHWELPLWVGPGQSSLRRREPARKSNIAKYKHESSDQISVTCSTVLLMQDWTGQAG